MSLLYKSVGWGSLEDIKKYWTRDNIEQALIDGLDPILLASLRGDEAILKFLLDSGIDITPKRMEAALMKTAAMQGSEGIFRLLLEYGVDRKMYRRGFHTHTPTLSFFHTAAIHGNVGAVRMLLEFGFSILEQADPPAFMQSEEKELGRKHECRLPGLVGPLIGSLTPLEYACLLGHVEVVRVLLDSDREPWIHSSRALHLAVVKRKYSALAAFQQHSDHEQVVQMLLEKGFAVDTTADGVETPLCFAVKFGSVNIARILLKAGANVNFQGLTPLLCCVINSGKNQEEMLKLLIANGANISATDSNGSTVLHNAAQVGCPRVVKLLLESGSDPNARTLHYETPLSYGLDRPEIVDILLSYGAEVNGFSKTGISPLLQACRSVSYSSYSPGRFNLDICRKLLKAGADPNAVCIPNESPLGVAVTVAGDASLTDLLVSYGASVYYPNRDKTLLHTAWRAGSRENIVALLDYGAHFVSDENAERCFRGMVLPHNPLDRFELRRQDPFEFYFIKMNAAQIGSSSFYVKHPLNPCNTDPSVRNEFRAQCEKEVDKLKKTMVGQSNISYHALLKRTLPVYRGDFAEALKSLVDGEIDECRSGLPSEYPNYWRLLKVNIRRGIKRGKLYEEGHRVLKRIPDLSDMEFPIEVMDRILSYLTDEELANLRDVLSLGRIASQKKKRESSH